MRTRKLKIGLVGAGRIAQTYAEALQRSSTACLHAVADVRREAAGAISESFRCRSFDSHLALAREGGVEAAIVCTPPVTHPAICSDLAKQGLHVLCEKPFSIRRDQARAMIAAARKAGVLITMASKFRFVPEVAHAKSLVASGVLGEVLLFENAFTAKVDMSRRWNSHPRVSGGGVLIDNGTHSVDIARYFLGPLAEVSVVEAPGVHGLRVEETVLVHVRNERGVLGSIDLSWSLNKEQDTYISVYGLEGTLKIGWKQSSYRRATDKSWEVFGSGYEKARAFGNQIENFVRAIRGEEELLVTPDDAMASVAAIEAAYRSMRQGKWTAIVNEKKGRR
ncbi:MAG: Gfo/Idh/MocA family oxidoreductase [Verrucomicrobia bacterium]|nr:Gfo/Idh/MocA family oxidoreductase [Verrucomicrobiota bacterium]